MGGYFTEGMFVVAVGVVREGVLVVEVCLWSVCDVVCSPSACGETRGEFGCVERVGVSGCVAGE